MNKQKLINKHHEMIAQSLDNQNLFDCVDCVDCSNCDNCVNCIMCMNCVDCSNCIMCVDFTMPLCTEGYFLHNHECTKIEFENALALINA